MMVLMMKRRMTLAVFSFLAIMILVQGTPVNAHTPGPMNLSYDFASQILTVDVTHSVADVNTHYIVTVTIDKNSVEVLSKSYTSQNTTSGFSANYLVPAVDGDVLEVNAVCFISGQTTDDITVSDPSVTTTPTDGGGTPMDTTLLIAVAVIVIGIIAVVFALMKRR